MDCLIAALCVILNGYSIGLNLGIKCVNLLLNRNCETEGCYNPAIGADVFEVEAAPLAVLQPYLADLVAANLV